MTEILYDFIDINTLTEHDIAQTLKLMSEEKQARMARISNAKRRLQSIAAEHLARKMISDRLNIIPELIRFGHSENGQPTVIDIPHFISLSHSGHLSMCAVSDRPVGADIEMIGSRGQQLLKRICSPEEQEFIMSGGIFAPERFYAVWTAKEAVLKRTGKGLSGDMSSVITASATSILPCIEGYPLITGIYNGAAYAVHG